MIELMVTLSVLAVMLAAAAPSFADFFERYRLRSAVDDTLSIFAQARQAAVEADRNVGLSVIGTTDWCVGAREVPTVATGDQVLLTAACSCDATPPTDCTVDGNQLTVDGSGRPGVSLEADGSSGFTYDSKGGTLTEADLAATPQIDFLSSSGKYGLSVRVSALGQARACVIADKRPVPGYQPCSP